MSSTSTRTSSSSSPVPFEGDYSFVNVVTDGTWPESWGKPPKTRKRITKQQLEMLEDLFRTHSHPSREERQMLALKTGMELRSVTIWLQNKRQLVKKNARAKMEGQETSSSPSSAPASPPPTSTRTTASPSPTPTPTPIDDNESSSSTRIFNASAIPRPTLDRVASLSEYPSPVRPITNTNTNKAHLLQDTPTRQDSSSEPLWSHMPSSPPTSPPSPLPTSKSNTRDRDTSRATRTPNPNPVLHKVAGRPYPQPPLSRTLSTSTETSATSSSAGTCVSTRDYSLRQRETERAKYLKPSMTLEWACAQAATRGPTTEEEVPVPGHVPSSSQGSTVQLPLSRASSATLVTTEVDVDVDVDVVNAGDAMKASDEEMQAALALCGLLAS